jgi:hypothetical protein
LISLRKDKKAASPAISTVILTAAIIVLVLVAMTYAQNILGLKVAENEYTSNKQFLQTTGDQIDDVAWSIGRTQTISFSNRYGNVQFKDAALDYAFSIQTASGWEDLTFDGSTGVLMYNMPVSAYSMGNDYFERIPSNANSSFILSGSTSPISQVLCEEKLPMNDGSFNRIVLVPTIRMLESSLVNSQNQTTNYYKFYLPSLDNGTNHYSSQSITLTGNGISKVTRNDVNQVRINVSYPLAASLGLDSSFFNFQSDSITLTLPSHSVVEFYIGKVVVTIGQV